MTSTFRIVRGFYTPVQQVKVGKGKKAKLVYVATGKPRALAEQTRRNFIDYSACKRYAESFGERLPHIAPFNDLHDKRTFAWIM